jgi:hypothetical protein
MMDIRLTLDATPALLDALTNITGALRGLSTPAQAHPQAAPQNTAPAPSVAPPPPVAQAQVAPTTEPDYSPEQLGRAASAFMDVAPDNQGKLIALLQQFGVQAITQLTTPAMRTAFANGLRGLGAQV